MSIIENLSLKRKLCLQLVQSKSRQQHATLCSHTNSLHKTSTWGRKAEIILFSLTWWWIVFTVLSTTMLLSDLFVFFLFYSTGEKVNTSSEKPFLPPYTQFRPISCSARIFHLERTSSGEQENLLPHRPCLMDAKRKNKKIDKKQKGITVVEFQGKQ